MPHCRNDKIMLVFEGDGEEKHHCVGPLEHCKYLQYAQPEVRNIIQFHFPLYTLQFPLTYCYGRQFKRKTDECMKTYQLEVIKMIKAGYDESSVSIWLVTPVIVMIDYVPRLKTGGHFPMP